MGCGRSSLRPSTTPHHRGPASPHRGGVGGSGAVGFLACLCTVSGACRALAHVLLTSRAGRYDEDPHFTEEESGLDPQAPLGLFYLEEGKERKPFLEAGG